MFNIDATEIIILIVLAILMFGPERIPQFSRKLARVVVYLRGIANNAQSQLREELGPEYSHLTINDLNPKTFVRKHLSNEIALIEEAKGELSAATSSVRDTVDDAKALTEDAKAALHHRDERDLVAAGAVFDPEAT